MSSSSSSSGSGGGGGGGGCDGRLRLHRNHLLLFHRASLTLELGCTLPVRRRIGGGRRLVTRGSGGAEQIAPELALNSLCFGRRLLALELLRHALRPSLLERLNAIEIVLRRWEAAHGHAAPAQNLVVVFVHLAGLRVCQLEVKVRSQPRPAGLFFLILLPTALPLADLLHRRDLGL
jgi:hypothetical protein